MSGLVLASIALGVAVLTFYIWFKRAFSQSIPDNILGFKMAMALSMAMGIVAFIKGVGLLGGVLAVLAIFFSVFYFGALFVGQQKTSAEKITVGQPLPGFTALTEEGASFSSDTLHGAPYLLKFFRGHW